MTDLQSKYAAKIEKLLRKAESTSVEAEAEAFIEKAQDLMTRYAIEEGMLDRDGKEREEIVERKIVYTGYCRKAEGLIGVVIAQQNGCRVFYTNGYGDGARGGESYRLHVCGFEGDVERTVMLATSVNLQARAGAARYVRSLPSYLTGHEKGVKKREWLFGFREGLEQRLRRARKVAEAAVIKETDETRESVALVVRSRKDRVDDWMDAKYGKLRKGVARTYRYGGADARDAGRSAGRNADTGHGGALRARKELTS